MAASKSQIIENAQRYAASGKIDEAIAEWTHLLSETVQAQDGNIYNAISDLYLRKNDKESAIQACLKAAQVYKETGFDLKGVAVLKKIFKIDPDRIDIHERLADINLERGLTGSAIEGYQKTTKLYMQRGNFKAAIGVYKKLSSFYPEDPEIPLAIGRLHQKLEQNREAILAYEQAEAIYESKNMTAEAQQIVEEIVKLNPNYIKSLAKKEASVAELDNIVSAKDIALPVTEQKEASVAELDNIASAKDIALPVTEQHEGYNPRTSVSEYNTSDLLHGLPETGSDSAQAPFHPPNENMAVPEGSNAIEGVLFSEASSQKESFLNLEEGASVPSGQTRIFNEESDTLPSRMRAKNVETREAPDVTEVIFRAHLAEVDVYLRYGLHQNAIEKLILAKELAPTREEPYLRLRELYLKEGQNEKAAHEVLALIKIYERQGRHDKKEALLAEMRTLKSGPEDRLTAQDNLHPLPYSFNVPPVGTPPPSYNEGVSNAGGAFVPPPPPPPPLRPVGGSVPLTREGVPRGGFPAGGSRSQDWLRSEDEYFDLGSAVANELGPLTESPGFYQTPEKAQALSEQGVYKDKRQQYIETCHHLGIAHKEMGNYEKAVRELEQALPGALGKQFQEILLMLASCYAESGYVAQAIHLLQGRMDDHRCNADIRLFIQYELASYFEQLGDRERSFSLYKEIYRADPHFKDVSGKVKEIPYRRAGSDPGLTREKPQDLGPVADDTAFQKIEPVKDKRRISYV